MVDRANRQACFFKMVSPSYFRTLGMKLRKGRGLGDHDLKGTPPVTVINETMARKYFPGKEPIGERILIQEIVPGKTQLGPEIPWEVVGVVADEKVTISATSAITRASTSAMNKARCSSSPW